MNALNRNIEVNEILAVNRDIHKPEYQTTEWLLFVAKGGFGMLDHTIGSAIFGYYLADGEECRREGYDFDPALTAAIQNNLAREYHAVKTNPDHEIGLWRFENIEPETWRKAVELVLQSYL